MKRILCLLSLFIFFSIVAFPQSDLIWYGTITLNPASPNEGDSVKFTATVRATVADSKAFAVKGGIDGMELFSKNCPALLKTTKNTVTFTWTATAGNHTVYFEIDPNQTSGDINYKNNYIEIPFTVGTGTTPPPPPRRRGQLPNLIVKNVTWNPQIFNQGDKVDFQIVVANIGSGPSPVTYATLDINGTTYMSCFVDALQPGDTDTVPASGTVNGCPINVTIKADNDNLTQESNEGDNVWNQTINCAPTIIEPAPLPVLTDIGRPPKRHREPGDPQKPTFTIAGTPNLTISDVDWSPKVFNDNQKVTLTYTAKNTGNGAAEPSPSISVSRGNSTKVNAPGAPGTSVPPGWSKNSAYIWNAKCGDKITITIDPGNITNETNEADNSWEHTFGPPHCTPTFIPDTSNQNLPNLRVTSSRLRPLKTGWNTGTVFNFDVGDIAVDITFTIKNDGNVAAVATKYQLIINNQVILTDSIALGPNQEKQIGWYAEVNCGSTFVLKLDYNNILIESNELDNQSTAGPWPKCN